MTMNKNILISTLVALGLASSGLTMAVAAETESKKESKHQMKHDRWSAKDGRSSPKYERFQAELNLSETQQEKIKAINSTFFEGMASLRASGESRESKSGEYRSLREKRNQEMEQVLDKDQYARYTEMRQEMRSKYKSRKEQ